MASSHTHSFYSMCSGFEILCLWDLFLVFTTMKRHLKNNISSISAPVSSARTENTDGKNLIKWVQNHNKYRWMIMICCGLCTRLKYIEYLVYERFWTSIVNSTSHQYHQNKKRSSIFWNTGVHPCSVFLCVSFFSYSRKKMAAVISSPRSKTSLHTSNFGNYAETIARQIQRQCNLDKWHKLF